MTMQPVAWLVDPECAYCDGNGFEHVYVDGGTRRVVCNCVCVEPKKHDPYASLAEAAQRLRGVLVKGVRVRAERDALSLLLNFLENMAQKK